MAIITLGINTLQAKATTQGKARAIYRSKGNLTGSAKVQAKIIKRMKTGAASSGAASTVANTRTVRYVKASVLAKSTISTKQFRLLKYAKGSATATAKATGRVIVYKTVSASVTATATATAYRTDRDNLYAMKDYLPKYYGDIREAMKIIQTEANEITKVRAELNRLFDQFFVVSNDVTLDRWENILGIEYVPNRSNEARRNLINAKLRGTNTSTLATMKSIVGSFYKSDVTERNSANSLNIKITERRGVPKNMPDVKHAVQEVIPAHIKPVFGYSFVPWSEVEAVDMRFEDANSYSWETLQASYPQAPATWSRLENTTQADTDVLKFSDLGIRLEFD